MVEPPVESGLLRPLADVFSTVRGYQQGAPEGLAADLGAELLAAMRWTNAALRPTTTGQPAAT